MNPPLQSGGVNMRPFFSPAIALMGRLNYTGRIYLVDEVKIGKRILAS